MAFHNTINLKDDVLENATAKAARQAELIYHFFEVNPGRKFTPFEVQKALDMFWAPITSIRRAMTDLTTGGKLIKCLYMKPGNYGKPNHTWQLKKNVSVTQLNAF